MLVFAAETSCDETSICLMNDDKIIDHIIFSQEIHKLHGGVVPELASRSHLLNLQEITNKVFERNKDILSSIDVFCATCGPGLIGSLLVGSSFVKSLSIAFKKNFYPINHLEGHIYSTSFNNQIDYPQLVLLLTGGHTQIYLMENSKNNKLLGETVDDALGEAFDKTAKLLGLPYPGGKEIENKAMNGDENFFKLPKPLMRDNNFNFSFSGIKTQVNLLTKKNEVNNKFICDLSASFQKTISVILIGKIKSALEIMKTKNIKIKSLSVVGGVSNNNYIRKKLKNFAEYEKLKIYYPIKEMMGDNAAMIGWACINNINERKSDINFKANPRMKIGTS